MRRGGFKARKYGSLAVRGLIHRVAPSLANLCKPLPIIRSSSASNIRITPDPLSHHISQRFAFTGIASVPKCDSRAYGAQSPLFPQFTPASQRLPDSSPVDLHLESPTRFRRRSLGEHHRMIRLPASLAKVDLRGSNHYGCASIAP